MARLFKIILEFNMQNLSRAMNSFVFRDGLGIATDSALLAFSEDWVTAMWADLRPHIDTQCNLIAARLDEISFSTGDVIRHVGGFSPTVNGTSGTEGLPQVSTGSCFARTNVPGVRGGKSIAGLVEGTSVDGLLTNPVVAALVTFVTRWLAGPPGFTGSAAGVWSSKVADFVAFVNQGGTSNVPGTRVTRRPGRGM